jgi:hypothetical protein
MANVMAPILLQIGFAVDSSALPVLKDLELFASLCLHVLSLQLQPLTFLMKFDRAYTTIQEIRLFSQKEGQGQVVWHNDPAITANLSAVVMEHGTALSCLKSGIWWTMYYDAKASQFVFPETFFGRFPELRRPLLVGV